MGSGCGRHISRYRIPDLEKIYQLRPKYDDFISNCHQFGSGLAVHLAVNNNHIDWHRRHVNNQEPEGAGRKIAENICDVSSGEEGFDGGELE
jgi:hypothetical protein